MFFLKKESGFTFLEISIVILILAILIAFAVPNYMGVQDEAQNAAISGDIATLGNAFSLCSIVNSDSMKEALPDGTTITALSDIDGNIIDPDTLTLYSIKPGIAKYYKKLNKNLDSYLVDDTNEVYYKGLFYGK